MNQWLEPKKLLGILGNNNQVTGFSMFSIFKVFKKVKSSMGKFEESQSSTRAFSNFTVQKIVQIAQNIHNL